jgi:hypothetical protein
LDHNSLWFCSVMPKWDERNDFASGPEDDERQSGLPVLGSHYLFLGTPLVPHQKNRSQSVFQVLLTRSNRSVHHWYDHGSLERLASVAFRRPFIRSVTHAQGGRFSSSEYRFFNQYVLFFTLGFGVVWGGLAK